MENSYAVIINLYNLNRQVTFPYKSLQQLFIFYNKSQSLAAADTEGGKAIF